MNNQLTVFEGREVTILLPDDVNFQFKGDFLIRAKDVAEILGYGQTKDLTALVKEKYAVLIKNSAFVKSESMNLLHLNTMGETFLTNHGLNQALANSTMPKAEPFQDWLYEEVLPAVQKHGGYLTPAKIDEILSDPDTIIKLATDLKAERQKRLEAEKTNHILMHINKTYTATEIAKELGFKSAMAFNSDLANKKIQFKQNDTWVLYSNHADKGYTEIKQSVLDTGKIVYDRRWTQLGREFLLKLYKGQAA
jgi:anti-repressor protein